VGDHAKTPCCLHDPGGLLDTNPLDDIDNTRQIRGVVLAGRYFDRAALDRMLRGVAKNGRRPG
jgi:hypothetical protein